jgi:hypothetical protein
MTQVALFETPAEPVRKSPHELMWERSRHPSVDADVVAICRARLGEWLGINDFRTVLEKHDLQGVMGHMLGRIVRSGAIEDKNIYHGDEHPGGKNYQGYHCVYRIVEAA